MSWILVIGAVTGLSVGQVLFRMGAIRLNENAGRGLLGYLNVPILTALVIYALCTVLWIGALRTLPLRLAYPVAALSYLLVPLLGHFFLHEEMSARTLVGGTAIILGIVISVSSGR